MEVSPFDLEISKALANDLKEIMQEAGEKLKEKCRVAGVNEAEFEICIYNGKIEVNATLRRVQTIKF